MYLQKQEKVLVRAFFFRVCAFVQTYLERFATKILPVVTEK